MGLSRSLQPIRNQIAALQAADAVLTNTDTTQNNAIQSAATRLTSLEDKNGILWGRWSGGRFNRGIDAVLIATNGSNLNPSSSSNTKGWGSVGQNGILSISTPGSYLLLLDALISFTGGDNDAGLPTIHLSVDTGSGYSNSANGQVIVAGASIPGKNLPIWTPIVVGGSAVSARPRLSTAGGAGSGHFAAVCRLMAVRLD